MATDKRSSKNTVAAKRGRNKVDPAQQYETMSQKQNRSGKGRQQNGSDGTGKGRGSNH
jgi:hypothetical protein